MESKTFNDFQCAILSAVDQNTSREAIQKRYPARILSASTRDLRVEVLRCGPPGIGACLRCYNPPEKIVPDAEARQRLKNMADNELGALASKAEITVQEAKEWGDTGRCGIPGERLLPFLRIAVGEHPFAVGFVSVMAGTMLAGELVKDYMNCPGPLSESAQRACFQFRSPLARIKCAGTYPRDPNCPMCQADTIACQTWRERYDRLLPKRL